MPGRKNDETIPLVRVRSREAWRSWLEDHHRQESSVWLVLYKKGSGEPTLTYAEAVEEALCFGWVDSKMWPWRYRFGFS
jgi:uncharacterized protein YdeI (YjbR/CyaY-like superfamily)